METGHLCALQFVPWLSQILAKALRTFVERPHKLGIEDDALVDALIVQMSFGLSSSHDSLKRLMPWLSSQHGPEKVALYKPTWSAMNALLYQVCVLSYFYCIVS